MREDLAWLGLDWDAASVQSEARAHHEAGLDRLAAAGRLYPCSCSRRDLRAAGRPAPDGGVRYPGTCRARSLPAGGWRDCEEPLRLRLEGGAVRVDDESGLDLSQDVDGTMGDPVVRRRDGAVSYHLAGVIDDARAGVTRVVRGRDLAASTATQAVLQELLGLPRPRYRHHLLLLEERGEKFAKLHGAVDAATLRKRYDAAELCGVLAHAAGLLSAPRPTRARELLADFAWNRVREADRVMRWTGETLATVAGP